MNCHLSLSRRIALEVNRAAFDIQKLEHPLTQLFWECTLRCNLNCRHCGSDCRVSAGLADPPVEDLLGVLDSCPENVNRGNIMVITTGGEPLVRADIVQVGQKIRKRGYAWGMVTNGMLLTRDKLNGLIDAGLNSLAMSLDGFEAEHNWMRGNDQSFSRANAALDYLVEKSNVLTWDVITCVNSRNIGSLEQFKEYLIGRGVTKWRIFTVAPMGRAVQEPELMITDTQFAELMEFIVRTRREGRIELNFACEGFLGPYEGLARDHFFNCIAGVHVASVLSDGSISGCLSMRSDYHQGNIHKDNFWTVWENGFQQYRDRRWTKKDDCAHCKVWRYCQGGAMHLRDGNGGMLSCNYLKLKKG